MPVLMTLEIPRATTEQYDRVNERSGLTHRDENAPDGLLSDVLGVTDDGILALAIGPAAAAAGLAPLEPRFVPVYKSYRRGG
jgi:hypothetical protein